MTRPDHVKEPAAAYAALPDSASANTIHKNRKGAT